MRLKNAQIWPKCKNTLLEAEVRRGRVIFDTQFKIKKFFNVKILKFVSRLTLVSATSPTVCYKYNFVFEIVFIYYFISYLPAMVGSVLLTKSMYTSGWFVQM